MWGLLGNGHSPLSPNQKSSEANPIQSKAWWRRSPTDALPNLQQNRQRVDVKRSAMMSDAFWLLFLPLPLLLLNWIGKQGIRWEAMGKCKFIAVKASQQSTEARAKKVHVMCSLCCLEVKELWDKNSGRERRLRIRWQLSKRAYLILRRIWYWNCKWGKR